MEPVFFDAVGYNSDTDAYEMSQRADLMTMSGTQVRDALRSDRYVPDWFMRDIVQEGLLDELRRGNQLFVE